MRGTKWPETMGYCVVVYVPLISSPASLRRWSSHLMRRPECTQQQGGTLHSRLSEAAYRFKVHSGTCVISHNGADPRQHHYMHICS